MHEDTENVHHSITALDSGEECDIDPEEPSAPCATLLESFTSVICDILLLLDEGGDEHVLSDRQSDMSLSDEAIPSLDPYMPSFHYDCNGAATSSTSDLDQIAQYMNATWDSPFHGQHLEGCRSWPFYDRCFCVCSQDLHQAMVRQACLRDIFQEDLHGMIPNYRDYNSAWLGDVEPDPSPGQSYEEWRWHSAVSDSDIAAHSQHEGYMMFANGMVY